MHTFLDTYGDQHTVSAGIMQDTGERRVYFDDSPFTPAQAREIADHLSAWADVLERPLIAIPGGAA